MLVKVPYGNSFLQTDISEEQLELVVSRPLEPIRDFRETVEQKLNKPLHSKPLRNLLSKNKKVCIIVPDETRACPTKSILPPLLDELDSCKPKELEILIGNGLHREVSEEEMIELLGEEIVDEYTITNHKANDESQLVDLRQKTCYGTRIKINKVAAKSDYLLGVGLVEPHFFAGYSGGRKTVLPAVAGEESIFNNHSYKMIDHPRASYGILEGNPVHYDMLEFMSFTNLVFIINVTINCRGEPSQVFAGDPIETHKQAVNFLDHHVKIKLRNYADIVIVSNGGYPLDRDLYQLVKSIATAYRVVKKGGTIISVAECRDELGGHEDFRRLMQYAERPGDVLKEIKENEPINDQWQAQILAKILEKVNVIVVTEGVNPNIIRKMMMETSSSLDEALDLAQKNSTDEKKIVAIPEGPYVIPYV